MAKIRNDFGFSGRLGNVVLYRWRGIPCLRAYRSRISYPNTVEQQQQKSRFVAMVRMASDMVKALDLGFEQVAEREGMTTGNYFVRKNNACFQSTAEGVEVDYKGLQLSEGVLAAAEFRPAQVDADGVLEVRFDLKSREHRRHAPSDRVQLFAYCPALADGMLVKSVERSRKVMRSVLPAEWQGQEVHLYGFVVDRQGRASQTVYIPMACLTAGHREELGDRSDRSGLNNLSNQNNPINRNNRRISGKPEILAIPDYPGNPEIPGNPDNPGNLGNPGIPVNPGILDNPESPGNPGNPDYPEGGRLPNAVSRRRGG